jgi:hypothetical protein
MTIPAKDKGMDRYQIEDDVRTLARAAEIRKDKTRYAAAVKLSRETHAAVAGDDKTKD